MGYDAAHSCFKNFLDVEKGRRDIQFGISFGRSGRNQMVQQGPTPNPVPQYYCPHCHKQVVPERRLIIPQIPGHKITPRGPEWHCNSCGTTFAPDYFDEALQ